MNHPKKLRQSIDWTQIAIPTIKVNFNSLLCDMTLMNTLNDYMTGKNRKDFFQFYTLKELKDMVELAKLEKVKLLKA